MSKKIFEIEKSEEFMAGMSTSVIINLSKEGKGLATIGWKYGEYKQVPVQVGQRLVLNMWGRFPDIEVWDAPMAPKDPVKKLLWNHGFTAKMLKPWSNEKAMDKIIPDNLPLFLPFYKKKRVALWVDVQGFRNCNDNFKCESVRKVAIAIHPEITLDELRNILDNDVSRVLNTNYWTELDGVNVRSNF